MDLGLKGKVAFVAGASSGLGKAVAQVLLEEGAYVAVCSRDTVRIDATAEDLRRTTGAKHEAVLPLTCDVTQEAAIKTALEATLAHFGALHILVANAGGPPAGLIDDFDADQWRAALDLNLLSTINLCRHALPALRQAQRKEGFARVLMITSISAKQPVPNLYLSNVARAGVQGFAKSLAEELGPEGITVNTILPGYTRTDRLAVLADAMYRRTGQSLDAIEAGWAAGNALKRLGSEEEFAAAAAFLVSARASYVTGVAFQVDGGLSKHLL